MTALAKLPQEFVRRNKERILLKDAADDDHRVGAHDVHDRITPKTPEMVGT